MIAIGAAVLVLAGHEIGLFLLMFLAGTTLGMALVHFATLPRRARKAVALAFLLSIPVLYLGTIAGLIHNVEKLVLAPGSFRSPFGGLSFGLIIGGGQVAFGRLVGCGA